MQAESLEPAGLFSLEQAREIAQVHHFVLATEWLALEDEGLLLQSVHPPACKNWISDSTHQ